MAKGAEKCQHAIMLAVSKKWAAKPAFWLVLGLAITFAALFAEQLGLDRSAGWGRGRIALLSFGVLLTIFTVVTWREGRGGHTTVEGVPAAHSDGLFSYWLHTYWPVLPLSVFVVVVYVWFASSGTWSTWTSQTRYYADLAHGFQKGHLYLAIRVPTSLINSPDPYEPSAPWVSQGPIDYSYYRGRYYLAWEPVPALIVWLVRVTLQVWLGDLQLTFGFLCGIFLVQCLLMMWIWDHFFQALPRWLPWVSMLLAGVAGPTTFMLNNINAGRIYDAAIAGGQFFLLSGFLCAVLALQKRSSWCVALAGTSWALSVGTRPDLVLPIGVMVLGVSTCVLRRDGWSVGAIKAFSFLCVPLLIGGVLVGWYNWARFGSIFETGYFYQMAGVNIHKYWNARFSLRYVIPNLYGYLLNPVLITRGFPFSQVQASTLDLISSFVSVPNFYYVQMLTGILWSAPFVIFALVPLAGVGRFAVIRQQPTPGTPVEEQRLLSWIQWTLGLSCLVALGLVLSYFWAAMRFLENFTPSLILLSAIGFWQGYQQLVRKRFWQRSYAALGVILSIVSIVISILGTISVLMLRFDLATLFPILR